MGTNFKFADEPTGFFYTVCEWDVKVYSSREDALLAATLHGKGACATERACKEMLLSNDRNWDQFIAEHPHMNMDIAFATWNQEGWGDDEEMASWNDGSYYDGGCDMQAFRDESWGITGFNPERYIREIMSNPHPECDVRFGMGSDGIIFAYLGIEPYGNMSGEEMMERILVAKGTRILNDEGTSATVHKEEGHATAYIGGRREGYYVEHLDDLERMAEIAIKEGLTIHWG